MVFLSSVGNIKGTLAKYEFASYGEKKNRRDETMKKKVLLMLFCVILAATGLAGCSEEKESVEAAKKTAEKR